MTKRELTFVSLLAGNADLLHQAIVAEMGAAARLSIRVVDGVDWRERERLFEQGEADLAAVCGAVYTRLKDRSTPSVQMLAAPVMRAARYEGKPVYFSDVLVRADAPFHTFDDLAGATWVYNEPGSYSGYAVLRAYLAKRELAPTFFRHVRASGSHQASLEALLRGDADVTAIDSIVFERAVELRPALSRQLRAILTLGPSPAPPYVASAHLAPEVVAALQAGLSGLHRYATGRRALEAARVARFVPTTDSDYHAIRHRLAEGEQWVPR